MKWPIVQVIRVVHKPIEMRCKNKDIITASAAAFDCRKAAQFL